MRGLILIFVLTLGLATASSAQAGQQGGSILYRDADAQNQELEFRAWVWRARGDYSKAAVEYREVSRGWRALDRNWCWTRRCALKEMVSQARYIARDAYIWRFQEPRAGHPRAARFRFDEVCYREGIRSCVDRLLDASR